MVTTIEFTVKKNDKEIALKAVKPTHKQRLESEKIRNTVFREALKSGAFIMDELFSELKKRGYWDDDKDSKIKDLQDYIINGVNKLNEGGFDIADAKKLALDISAKRVELANLATIRGNHADKTAEGQANNASFDYLVSQCVVYNTNDSLNGKPYFESYEDYLNRKTEEDASEAAGKFFELVYNKISDDSIANLPENQFLKEFGFVNDELRLIDEQGRLIDEEGRLIDSEGYYINEAGQRIDLYGNLIDESGKPIIDKAKRKPFTKNGEIISVKDETVTAVTSEAVPE